MFKLENIKYKKILKIEKLIIPKDKITSILGASGSGKTTLLRHLNKMISPNEGKIFYNDKDFSNINSIELRRKIVMLSQTPAIFSGTIKHNLQIGLELSEKPLASDKQLSEVLDMVDLKKSLEADAEKLSGGEKQRLALGRVILMDPEVFLLDEPSSALDEHTENLIIEKLCNHVKASGKTLVMVTHSKNIALKFSDYIIEINNGKVVNRGEV